MAKATVFYEDYERVVTPTSKNVVLEYKGGSSAWFTFNVEISGKNANKYDSRYQNIATRSGDDLVITTVFISLKGSEKIVTTTVKNYFIENLLQEIDIKSTLLKDETICIDQNTKFGANGLYGQVGDGPYSDYILAPDYKTDIHFADDGYDHIYDTKGDDIYYANGGMIEYFLDLNGNDSYNSSNGNITIIRDTKGDDKYLSDNPSTKISTIDYKGNDEYKSTDFAKIHSIDYNGNDKYILEDDGSFSLAQDIKGNDEYYLGSHTASNIQDEAGNDKYTLLNAWVESDANAIEDRYGNDKYDIEKSIAVNITDYSGKDEYKIKNIDTSTNDYVNSNFNIVDYSGNDKYELENISSSEVQTRSYITDELGNDSYFATNVNYVSFYDEMGNDKYNFIAGKNVTIYDYLGKDTYTLKGTESEKLSNLTIDDMETSKKSASDKYILEKTDHVGITDNAGNDNYDVKDSNDCIINDNAGNDKYTLQNRINGYINDYDGKDTYKSEGDTTLSSVDITDNGTSSDTYTLNGGNLLSITDEGGNNKFTISNCYESGIEATGNGNDTYKYTNMSDCWIDDNAGNDKYTVDKCSMVFIEDIVGNDTYKFTEAVTCNITDESGNDKYNLLGTNDKNIYETEITDKYGNDKYSFNGQIINTEIDDLSGIDTYSNNSKSELTCIHIYDKGADKDTYKLNNVEGTIEDEGGDNTFAINAGVEFYVTASGLGNDKYNFKNIRYWYIEDAEGNDNYTLSKCSTGSITDNVGNDKYNLQNCYDVNITDKSGDDRYTIDIKGIKNGHHYIADYVSDAGDTLTIKGLNTKNIMYLSDYDKDGNATGDMIIFDKSSKSYIQIDSFFNYSTEFNVFEGDFEYGQIETIKVGGKKLDINAMEMSTYLDNISITVGNWLSANSYDDVCTLFDVGKEEDISNFITYMTES